MFELLEAVERLAPALRLVRLLPRGVLADELLRLLDVRLLLLDKTALAFEVDLALNGVVAVAKRVDAQALRPELQRLRAGRVEERAVVAHDEYGAAVALQPALEPRDRVEIEVVRGLVEEQEVRLLREYDAEMQPPALAARERHDGPREIGVGEAKLGGDRSDLVLERVAASDVIALRRVGEPVERVLVAGPRLFLRLHERGARLDDVAERGHERAEHVAVCGDLVRLAGSSPSTCLS